MEVKLVLSNSEHKELVSYCNLNDLLLSEVVKKCFTTGFNIERYGLLNSGEKTKEVIKEVVKVEYVEVEKPVEKIVEVIVEKQVGGDLQPKLDALQNTVMKLKQDNIEKDRQIKEYEKTIQEIQKFQDEKRAMFLRGSNLEDNLYK